MKLITTLIILYCISIATPITAQAKYITKGTISYEYKVNNHKNFANDDGEDNFWSAQMIENTPKVSTYYYDLKFNNNQSVYNYTSKVESAKKMWGEDELEDNIWYTNYTANSTVIQKSIFGDLFLLQDSIKKLQWKLLPGETREFANFTCKKAMTKLYDSVYVFAFYTENIILNGGPMQFNGLPGTILAITIPRLNVSCVATAYNPMVKDADILIPKKGKNKQQKDVYTKIKEVTKDWGKYGQKAIWMSFL